LKDFGPAGNSKKKEEKLLENALKNIRERKRKRW
jgi:hypothetical protein